MANTIKIKRSTVPGKQPLAADLEVGELAVNTADGKLYTKHTDNSVKTISGGTSEANIIANVKATITSNITSVAAGSEIAVSTDYTDPASPAGKFVIYQLGPITLTATESWGATGTAAKNAYTDYTTGTVNTSNVQVTLTLGNAAFSISGIDTITLGATTITGTDITGLGITGAGGIISIPSSLIPNIQTTTTVAFSANLTTTRGYKTVAGTTLTNTQPTPFTVSVSGSFPASTVPYFSTAQTLSWTLTPTGTVSSGNLKLYYAGNSAVVTTLSSVGGLTGTQSSLNSTIAYVISTNDYTGAGLNGAGTRTIPTAANVTITAKTTYTPIFYKVTASSANPNFTTSDSYITQNYAVGQSVNTTANTADWTWMAIPGSGDHTFHFVYGGFTVIAYPNQTYTAQTIAGQTYNYYGFNNYNAITALIVDS
jgi:hypothetical protein